MGKWKGPDMPSKRQCTGIEVLLLWITAGLRFWRAAWELLALELS